MMKDHYLENYLHLHEVDEKLINWLNGIERVDTTDSVFPDGDS